MSVVKKRNKQQKSIFLKMYWKVYKEWMIVRAGLGFEGAMGEFSKRMVRSEVKRKLNGG